MWPFKTQIKLAKTSYLIKHLNLHEEFTEWRSLFKEYIAIDGILLNTDTLQLISFFISYEIELEAYKMKLFKRRF